MKATNQQSSSFPTLKWNQLKPMPFKTWWASSCLIDQLIFVFGGSHPNQYSSTKIKMFNPKTNEWSLIEQQFEMPTPRSQHSANQINEIAFLIGGWDQKFNALSTIESFNPKTKEWNSNHPTMSTPRFEHSSCVVDENIFIFGGYNYPQYLSTIEVFDPKINKLNTLNSQLQTLRAYFSATKIDDSKIMLIGGYNNGKLSSIEIFDSKTQQSTLFEPSLPFGLEGHQSCLIKERIFVFGGWDGEERSKKVLMFNFQQQQSNHNNNNQKKEEWIINSQTQFDHDFATSVVVDSTIFIFGGGNSDKVESSISFYSDYFYF
jgi:N-acetylneuraminic acid mutarotase